MIAQQTAICAQSLPESSLRLRQPIALLIYAVALILSYASDLLGDLGVSIAGDEADWDPSAFVIEHRRTGRRVPAEARDEVLGGGASTRQGARLLARRNLSRRPRREDRLVG